MTQHLIDSQGAEKVEVTAICRAFNRLRKLGWREVIYAPRDKSPLLLIEAGSTGIHHGYRDDYGFWIIDVETWPSHPILWKQAP